ncbi:DUF1345 domain-containing protein [Phenylobacterium sp.]|uniref:DUF1345 domain-containing protein n=1 Tax=Phenylobacterium sp. TaxID=1871053 RepID=UPI00121502DA|nr:DUF1345 domain-containing protein [Phenylobacterium sp.]THD61461.1 MAG: DUF1345 domain-containing protein [Phenylobacterium sp.]
MARAEVLGWRRFLGPLGPRPRLTAGTAAGAIVGVALIWLAPQMHASTRAILAWDALSLTFLTLMFLNMLRHTPTDIRAQAEIDDEGRGVILALTLAAAAASIWAIGAELSLAKDAHGFLKAGHILLAFITVVASWLTVQMIFALHYAHEWYGVDEDDGASDSEGIEFPGHQPPDYWDFLYFSVVIGVACATADANITSRGLRRLATVHCGVAFVFNTIIVALTINLTAGLF